MNRFERKTTKLLFPRKKFHPWSFKYHHHQHLYHKNTLPIDRSIDPLVGPPKLTTSFLCCIVGWIRTPWRGGARGRRVLNDERPCKEGRESTTTNRRRSIREGVKNMRISGEGKSAEGRVGELIWSYIWREERTENKGEENAAGWKEGPNRGSQREDQLDDHVINVKPLLYYYNGSLLRLVDGLFSSLLSCWRRRCG